MLAKAQILWTIAQSGSIEQDCIGTNLTLIRTFLTSEPIIFITIKWTNGIAHAKHSCLNVCEWNWKGLEILCWEGNNAVFYDQIDREICFKRVYQVFRIVGCTHV